MSTNPSIDGLRGWREDETAAGRIVSPAPPVVLVDPDGATYGDRALGHAVLPATRTTMTVDRVKLTSVARVAFLMCMCVAAVANGAALAIWAFLSSTGTITNLESFVVHAAGVKHFRLQGGALLTGFVLLTLLGIVVVVVLAVAAAAFYNAIAATMGGITMDWARRGASIPGED